MSDAGQTESESTPGASPPNPLRFAAVSALLGMLGVGVGELIVAVIRGAHAATLPERLWLFADLVTFTLLVVLLPSMIATSVVVAVVRSRTGGAAGRLMQLAWGAGPVSRVATAAYVAGVLAAFGLFRAVAPHIPTDKPLVPRLLDDVSLLIALAVVIGVGRALVWWRGRSPHGWVLELGLLAITCWMVGFELTYFVVPTTLWYAPFVLAIAWTWISMRLVSSLSAPRRRWLAAGTGAVVLACVVATGATYDVASARHSALTWDTSVGAALWQVVKFVTDDDGDGYTDAFGGPDCDDADPEIHPGLPEDPLNGRDDNCVAGESTPLPAQPMQDLQVTQTSKPLNVAVITIDTLRIDAVGRLVDGKSVTPNLDRFATSAFVFERAYSASSHTAEAMPAAWTGTYPFDWRQHGLSFGIERGLAELLTAVGYQAWGTIAMTWSTRDSLIGFDDVDNELGYRASFQYTSDLVAHRALQRLDARDPARPFLMWTHFFDPHAPRLERDDLAGWLGTGTPKRAYMHEVHAADEAFGAVLDGLDERELLDETIVVVFADHGESLGEHGIATHKRNGHDSVMRVPLMIRMPDNAAGRSDALVSTVDILPTLTDVLGIQNVRHVYGKSLRPVIGGEPFQAHELVYFGANEGRPIFKAIATAEYKLIYDWRRDAYFFYDLVNDPGERRNLVDERPEEFSRMRATFWGFWDAAFSTPRLAHKAVKQKARQPSEPRNYRGPPLVLW